MGSYSVRLAAVLAALAWALGTAAAAPLDPTDKGKPLSAADKLRRELDKPVTIEINEQPINLAVNQLREQTHLNFVLDKLTLQQLGVDPDMVPVSAKLKDVKLRSALRTIFGPYNLGFAVIGDTILISSEEMAIYRQMHQRVNVDAEGVELTTAVRQLARETGTNLVIDPRVAKEAQGKITLQVEDVPLETAVRLMSEMVGLKPVRVGNTLFICSKTTAKDLREDENPPMQPMPGGPMPPGAVPGGGIGGGLVPLPRGVELKEKELVVPALPVLPPVAPPQVPLPPVAPQAPPSR